MNAPITAQILNAVQGDAAAIRALATAIASGDNAAVHSLLAERGVSVSAEELDEVVFAASGADACTFTCTYT